MATMEQLILQCPALHHYREKNATSQHPDLQAAQKDMQENPDQLVTSAPFVIISGLARMTCSVLISLALLQYPHD